MRVQIKCIKNGHLVFCKNFRLIKNSRNLRLKNRLSSIIYGMKRSDFQNTCQLKRLLISSVSSSLKSIIQQLKKKVNDGLTEISAAEDVQSLINTLIKCIWRACIIRLLYEMIRIYFRSG
ncbi:conserved hypothetical protein [Trichinella spiralis]|uniref:hypothetical protein n=1 Tax=Trichinella spiralis TaxID=6334 RepID=UPI0001EFBAAB|nr:conserved hypothetical protein [Trichinella spiralis]